MRINIGGGQVDATPMEFSLEEAERPVRIILEDGRIVQWRATVAAVFTWKDEHGIDQFMVSHNTSAVQIK